MKNSLLANGRLRPVSGRFALVMLFLLLVAVGLSFQGMEMPEDWFLENILVALFLLILALTWKTNGLSHLSYGLLLVFFFLHEYGAHYKYADVPLGEWLKPFFQTTRNHYDRVIHFSFGFLCTWPLAEAVRSFSGVGGRWWPALVALLANLSFSALYEMMEFSVAQLVAPEIGLEFVGAQGDIWDAEKDMALALIGSLPPLLLWMLTQRQDEVMGSSAVRSRPSNKA
jgi:putative membrane protein